MAESARLCPTLCLLCIPIPPDDDDFISVAMPLLVSLIVESLAFDFEIEGDDSTDDGSS